MPQTPNNPNETAKIDPVRPTDAAARQLARDVMAGAGSAALATLLEDGHPFSSLVSLAADEDGTALILISQLSAHAENLARDPRASLLVASAGKGDPLAHPRITLVVRAEPVPRGSPAHVRARERFLARQPKAALYIDFPDFLLVRLILLRASLNGGFGKAYALVPQDILDGPAN